MDYYADPLKEAADVVDRVFNIDREISDKEADISVLKEDRARQIDRLRTLVEGTGVTEVAGQLARAKMGLKSVPRVSDWQEVYAYIQVTGSFDLLHKRIGTKAVEERWNIGQNIPGIEQVVIPDIQVRGKR